MRPFSCEWSVTVTLKTMSHQWNIYWVRASEKCYEICWNKEIIDMVVILSIGHCIGRLSGWWQLCEENHIHWWSTFSSQWMYMQTIKIFRDYTFLCYSQKIIHPQKVTVWFCNVVGPYLIENALGRTVSLQLMVNVIKK